MIAQPVEPIREPQTHTWRVEDNDIRFRPDFDIQAFVAGDLMCTETNGVMPSNETRVDISGLTSCFISSDGTSGNGWLITHIPKSSVETLNSNFSLTDVCVNLGLQEEDVLACVAQLNGWGGVTYLDEEYAQGGTTIVLQFENNLTEIDMGGILDKRKYTREQIEQAFRMAGIMTSERCTIFLESSHLETKPSTFSTFGRTTTWQYPA